MLAVFYLLHVEKLLKVDVRQLYPGIVIFPLGSLRAALLRSKRIDRTEDADAIAVEPKFA